MNIRGDYKDVGSSTMDPINMYSQYTLIHSVIHFAISSRRYIVYNVYEHLSCDTWTDRQVSQGERKEDPLPEDLSSLS